MKEQIEQLARNIYAEMIKLQAEPIVHVEGQKSKKQKRIDELEAALRLLGIASGGSR